MEYILSSAAQLVCSEFILPNTVIIVNVFFIFYSFVHCSRFALYALVIFGDYVIIYDVKVYA